MRRAIVVFHSFIGVLVCASPLNAQEPPPRIPFLAVDLHAAVPNFPDDLQLAQSRALDQTQLPGLGFGGDVGVHVYPLKWRQVTFGLGGRLTVSRARQAPAASSGLPSVTERFTSLAPELSFNFGSGTGWSYLSGGLSSSTVSVVADGLEKLPADEERLKTINYGGGARWFAKPHLAFSFDVRFYAINPSAPNGALGSSPRMTLMIIGAGISVK